VSDSHLPILSHTAKQQKTQLS